jgi:hypothetical protein
MADARVPSITVQDMEPAAFRAMLHLFACVAINRGCGRSWPLS